MYEERIKAGAALLDRYAASNPGKLVDWRETIRTDDRFDTSFAHYCVLGLLFGGFRTGHEILGLSREEAEANGFYLASAEAYLASAEGRNLEYEEAYEPLTQEWLAYLNA